VGSHGERKKKKMSIEAGMRMETGEQVREGSGGPRGER